VMFIFASNGRSSSEYLQDLVFLIKNNQTAFSNFGLNNLSLTKASSNSDSSSKPVYKSATFIYIVCILGGVIVLAILALCIFAARKKQNGFNQVGPEFIQ